MKSKENHLYRIRLSLFSSGLTKKDRIFHSISVFIIILTLIIRSVLVIQIPEEYEYLLPCIGDIFSRFNLKINGNLLVIICASIVLLSQILHYYEYKKNLKPSYLKVFDVISGSGSKLFSNSFFELLTSLNIEAKCTNFQNVTIN